MIKNEGQFEIERITNMRGGNGTVEIERFLKTDEFHGKGRLFGKLTLKPGVSIGLHQHVGDCETFYILSGEGVFYDNGKSLAVKTGDVLYTDNNESHSIENTGKDNLVLIALILYV